MGVLWVSGEENARYPFTGLRRTHSVGRQRKHMDPALTPSTNGRLPGINAVRQSLRTSSPGVTLSTDRPRRMRGNRQARETHGKQHTLPVRGVRPLVSPEEGPKPHSKQVSSGGTLRDNRYRVVPELSAGLSHRTPGDHQGRHRGAHLKARSKQLS